MGMRRYARRGARRWYHYVVGVAALGLVWHLADSAIAAGRAHFPQFASSSTTSTTGVTPAVGSTTATTVTPALAGAAPSVSLITEPNQGMGPIYSFLSGAQHSLDIVMYEFSDPQAVSVLASDAARGVKVRILLDKDFSGGQVNQAAYDQLRAAGVDVKWAWPSVIVHEKSVVRDAGASSAAALISTGNWDSRHYSTSRDFSIATTDPASVSGMEATFDSDFESTSSGPPAGDVPAGSDLLWSPGSQSGLVGLIDGAKSGTTMYVENEEMDSTPIEQALEQASRDRGVHVDVVMTDSSSWHSAFDQLVAAGVHVSTYASSAPLYVHAKVIVADEASGSSSTGAPTLYLGSINFSSSSMGRNRELGTITTDSALVSGVQQVVQSDFAGATPYKG